MWAGAYFLADFWRKADHMHELAANQSQGTSWAGWPLTQNFPKKTSCLHQSQASVLYYDTISDSLDQTALLYDCIILTTTVTIATLYYFKMIKKKKKLNHFLMFLTLLGCFHFSAPLNITENKGLPAIFFSDLNKGLKFKNTNMTH